jgi:hypothetical protein
MGKTGSVQWTQVKGVKGQIRLVPRSEGEVKKPGPNQRFRAGATLKKLEEASGEGHGGFRGRSGGRGGRGGRGRSSESGPVANPMVRKAMRRSKASILGAKQKSSR